MLIEKGGRESNSTETVHPIDLLALSFGLVYKIPFDMIIDGFIPIGEKLILEHPDCMLRFLFIIKETI